jgi:hypothetical protein
VPEEEFPQSVEDAALDSLINDAESPWVVHADLVRDYGFSEAEVEEVVAILNRFVERGWARTHDPDNPTGEFWEEALAGYAKWLEPAGYSRGRQSYYPDYGPWYYLTTEGRSEWERRQSSK